MPTTSNIATLPTTQQPVLGVSAFVARHGKILVVQRGQAPGAGQIAFPGGKLLWGEPPMQGAERELFEETGVRARAQKLLDAVNIVLKDEQQKPIGHYVVLCYLCRWISGVGQASDDAQAVFWRSRTELLDCQALSPGVRHILLSHAQK